MDYILKEIELLKVWSRKIVHSSPGSSLICHKKWKRRGMGPVLTLPREYLRRKGGAIMHHLVNLQHGVSVELKPAIREDKSLLKKTCIYICKSEFCGLTIDPLTEIIVISISLGFLWTQSFTARLIDCCQNVNSRQKGKIHTARIWTTFLVTEPGHLIILALSSAGLIKRYKALEIEDNESGRNPGFTY